MQENTDTQQNQAKPSQPVMTGVRKRQQIQDTNKRIFIWLAVASVIVSVCLVALQFLVREFVFNQKIISRKNQTNGMLIKNYKEAEGLRNNVNALLADSNLNSLRYESPNTQTTALNVILDALPVSADSTAFANSLQAVVLSRSAVSIKELSTVSDDGTSDAPIDPAAASLSAAPSSGPQPLLFTAGFSGKYAEIHKALADLSKVIRPITLNDLTIRATDSDLLVGLSGQTYYLPAKTIEVRKEELKP